jgi:hypothetical protein
VFLLNIKLIGKLLKCSTRVWYEGNGVEGQVGQCKRGSNYFGGLGAIYIYIYINKKKTKNKKTTNLKENLNIKLTKFFIII